MTSPSITLLCGCTPQAPCPVAAKLWARVVGPNKGHLPMAAVRLHLEHSHARTFPPRNNPLAWLRPYERTRSRMPHP